MEAEVLARLDRLEAALSRVTTVLDQIEPNLAMVADMADDWVKTRMGGDAVEARVQALEQAVVRMSEPEVLGALTRLAEKAPKLERVADLAASFDDNVAMASDIADDFVRTKIGGDAVDERVQAGLEAAVRLSDPEVLGALTRLAEKAPKLEKLADLAASFDDNVAMTADIVDDFIRSEIGGEGLEARVSSFRDFAMAATLPETLEALRRIAGNMPKMERTLQTAEVLSVPEVEEAMLELSTLAPKLMRTARVAADLDAFVEAMSCALREPAVPLGPFGVLTALRDPDVQQGVGRAIHITRHLGRNEAKLPSKP